MRVIQNWQDELLQCHFCGTTKSVKYTIELFGTLCDNKPLEVCACNTCALINSSRFERKENAK